MKSTILCICLWPPLLFTAFAAPPDIRYPPKPTDIESLTAKGWEQAADTLGQALTDSYRPGIGGRPGVTDTPAYSAWLGVWKWCRALASDENDYARDLLRRHLVSKEGKPTFYPPGFIPDSSTVPLTDEELDVFLSNPKTREELLDNLIPSSVPRPEARPLADSFDHKQLMEWVKNAQLTSLIFRTVLPDDYLPGVLHHLASISASDPQGFRSYPALAVAIAVVHDQKFPQQWPHHQVPREAVPIEEVDPPRAFASWVAAARSNQLWIDPAKLSPGQLKFVVDAPIRESELVWARKNTRFPRTDFAKAFSAVKYRIDRLRGDQLVWNQGDYTLENILSTGGICVDQAYFATIVGKSRGLPTLYFSGQGSDGGHAWFGYLRPGGRWELDCGRYENQNYVVGYALDPQSWRRINDHELTAIADGFRESRTFQAAEDDRLLAREFERRGLTELARKAYSSAHSSARRNPATWADLGGFLARTQAPLADQIAFHEEAAKTFASDPDVRTFHLSQAANLYRTANNPEAAERISRQIVSQNRHQRADLSVTEGAQRILTLAAEGNSPDAIREYRRILSSVGAENGGSFFYEVVAPLTRQLLKDGKTKDAAAVVKVARQQLKPSPDSILDRAIESLENSKPE
ncbi:MAG: hypothetical protein Fur0032_01440 [Terrimicrobiaceae bacterium]